MTNSFENDEVSVQYEEHATNTFQKLLSFYEEKKFFDTILISGSYCIKIEAHKIILSALSEYFLEVFRRKSTDSDDNVVELKEIEASTLKLVVDFIYTGSIEFNQGTVERILNTAAFLKIKTLIDGCCDFIGKHLSYGNCFYWLRLAKELKLSELQDKSSNFIYTHFEKVSKEKEFLLLNEIDLKDLLFNENPYGNFEELILISLEAWIEYDCDKRKHLQLELLSMIRYQLLTPKFIIAQVSSETEENFKLMYSWLKWHWSKDSRSTQQLNYPSKKRKIEDKLSLIQYNNKKEIEIFQRSSSWMIKKRIPIPVVKKPIDCVIVIDEKLFLVGGRSEYGITTSVECLDLHTFKWTNLPQMTIRRHYSQLANLNGNICIFGGFDLSQNFIDTIEIFNFSTRQWQAVTPSLKPSKYSKIAAHNENLYIIDFYYGHLQTYNVKSKELTSKDINIDELKDFGFAATDGFLYVIGGTIRTDLSSVKRYDLSNDTWGEVSPLRKARSFLKCMNFKERIITYNENTKHFIEEYNPYTDVWKNIIPVRECNEYLLCSIPIDF